jgi:two-component sensor histidine kinase
MKKGTNRRTLSLLMAIVMSIDTGYAQPDTSRIAGLLKVGSDYVLRPGNEKKDLDSAQFFFNQALILSRSIRSDKWINATVEWQGDSYLEGNDLVHGEACFQQVIDYYRRKGDLRNEAATWARLGECITDFKPAFSAEKAGCYEHARQLYHLAGDTLAELEAYKNEADAHLYLRNFSLAEKELLAVIDGYKAVHFHRLHYTYDLLRAVSDRKGDLVKEVFYTIEMVRSLDSTDARDDSTLFGVLYASAGNTYAKAGMWDRSLYYSRKGWVWSRVDPTNYIDYFDATRAVVTSLLRKDSARAALVFLSAAIRQQAPVNSFTRAMMLLSEGNCYGALGDYGKAERAFTTLAVLLNSDKAFQRDHVFSQLNLEMILGIGNFYLLTHRYDKAEAYEKKLHYGVSDLTSLEQWIRIERFRSRVDSAMGRYDQALRHFEAFQHLKDSMFSVQRAVQIQEMQIQYAIEQKDKDLRIQAGDIQLLTKQNQLQEEQVGESRIFRNMMIAGLLTLLLVTGLIYNRYRLKQQKNQQLEVKQKEITDKNHQLERLVNENEWLLREVHHRVKNNLQVIISLLKSQSDFLDDKAALAAVVESEHRVYAMSLIHQKLYKSKHVSSINMPEYIGDLVEYLKYSFAVSGKLWFDLQIEPINLDLQQAVPIGLILNEVITNSCKYAFPYSDEDKIMVSLFSTGDGWLSLIIGDNGRGLPPNFDPRQHNSFGMLLIGGLTEDLEGTLQIESRLGTIVHIRFKQSCTRTVPEDGSQGSDYFNK